jgi:hypothetical protein
MGYTHVGGSWWVVGAERRSQIQADVRVVLAAHRAWPYHKQCLAFWATLPRRYQRRPGRRDAQRRRVSRKVAACVPIVAGCAATTSGLRVYPQHVHVSGCIYCACVLSRERDPPSPTLTVTPPLPSTKKMRTSAIPA